MLITKKTKFTKSMHETANGTYESWISAKTTTWYFLFIPVYKTVTSSDVIIPEIKEPNS